MQQRVYRGCQYIYPVIPDHFFFVIFQTKVCIYMVCCVSTILNDLLASDDVLIWFNYNRRVCNALIFFSENFPYNYLRYIILDCTIKTLIDNTFPYTGSRWEKMKKKTCTEYSEYENINCPDHYWLYNITGLL